MKPSDLARLKLSERDTAIVLLLIRCLPVLSLGQIATKLFANDRANALRSLGRLTKRGYIARYKCLTRTPPIIERPLFTWHPGQDAPSAYRLAYQLNRRWLTQGTRMRQCYTAGPALNALFGFSIANRPKHPLQISHELGLAGAYLNLCEKPGDRWRRWVGELYYAASQNEAISALMAGGTQKPDALILSEEGHIETAIEFGGVYNSKRLTKFHRWCQRERLSYEIW